MQDKTKDIILLGNIQKENNFKNPQIGRVYSIYGLCPTLNTCQGGGHEPKILVKVNGQNKSKTSN